MRYNLHSTQLIHLNGTIQWMVVQSQLCATISTINCRMFLSPQKETHLLLLPSPLFLPLSSLATSNLFSAYSGHLKVESYNMWSCMSGSYSLSIFSRFIHVLTCVSTLFLLHCLVVPHYVYPFVVRWTLEFLPFGYDVYCCCGRLCAGFCVDVCFLSAGLQQWAMG